MLLSKASKAYVKAHPPMRRMEPSEKLSANACNVAVYNIYDSSCRVGISGRNTTIASSFTAITACFAVTTVAAVASCCTITTFTTITAFAAIPSFTTITALPAIPSIATFTTVAAIAACATFTTLVAIATVSSITALGAIATVSSVAGITAVCGVFSGFCLNLYGIGHNTRIVVYNLYVALTTMSSVSPMATIFLIVAATAAYSGIVGIHIISNQS
ncbi:MAG: hypothetical protein HYT49_03945 [Candidatus Wildermuthbacteria bacterium]|nr:hypothetical protein [Candidatus Wildermuthbacteria bacterium]